MYSLLTAFASVLSLFQPTATDSTSAVEWSLLLERVHVGGCVQVIIEAPSRLAKRCKLSIDGRAPVRLVDRLGHTVNASGQTIVLLSHDILYAEMSQNVDGRTSMIRIPPIFQNSETMTLTMYLNGNAIGTKQIEVVPATDDMREAIDLLYPVVSREAAMPARENSLQWMRLVTTPMYGVTPRITHEQLQQIRDELPIIRQHPDWAEIAEALVARLECRTHYDELIVRENGRTSALKTTTGELPPWPRIVTRSLDSEPKSPFATAIQNDIRGLVRDIRIIDAQLRGEDILGILKDAAKTDR